MEQDKSRVKINVIFVCLGNICRSPLAEGIFKDMIKKKGLSDHFLIESSGTSDYHVDEIPNIGSIKVAAKNGIDISGQRARQFVESDLSRWDYVIAMGKQNMAKIEELGVVKGKSFLLRDFDENEKGEDVPDPWKKDESVFTEVFMIINRCVEKFFEYLKREHKELSNPQAE